MTQTILKALMRLYAIIAYIYSTEDVNKQKQIVELFLRLYVRDNELYQYTMMFDFYLKSLKGKNEEMNQKKESLYSVKSLIICEEINAKLSKDLKYIILLYTIEIALIKQTDIKGNTDLLRTISNALKIINSDFENTLLFVQNRYEDILNSKKILLIADNPVQGIKHQIIEEHLNGKIIVLQYRSTNIYVFRYIHAEDRLYLNNRLVEENRSYIFEKGSFLQNPKISSLYYSDIVKTFLSDDSLSDFSICAENIEFYFRNSDNGIQKMKFSAISGQMIGIMGGSGVGKSTFLNVLNGTLPLDRGRILINGYDLHTEHEKIEGLIGFIPQDDLLIEELTVYQNLYFNARLCFSGMDLNDLNVKVNKTLKDLDLYEIKNLKVGSPLKKFISGGQRKRLNIALELIREPYILLVDEPTSGLSSHDSENVIDLLKSQALNGKIVIINIHQPSSKIFKKFDKLLIFDQGGRTIYYGNPVESVVYFKKMAYLINADESECLTCGNVNPEQVLEIIESKTVNENGRFTDDRVISPKQWYSLYQKNIESNINIPTARIDLPKNRFKVPKKTEQFKIFSLRNLLTKVSDKQFLLINFLEAPLLAMLLGFFTKHLNNASGEGFKYIFSENENLPAYLFMSIIVALFLGMMVSAEEIIGDRKVLKREMFLNLSWNSYMNSKILLLFGISGIQTLTFVLIGNFMLEIKGMYLSYWLILFSTSCFANMLGLNLSAGLKSVVTIYITIPLMLVPQLLFAGVIVKFDKLNNHVTSQEIVPVIGDLMVSRWAYEALAVNQFKNNRYQKYFYAIERAESKTAFQMNYLIPELEEMTYVCKKLYKDNDKKNYVSGEIETIRNEIVKFQKAFPDVEFSYAGSLSISSFDEGVAQSTINYLSKIKKRVSAELDKSIYNRDEQITSLIKKIGSKDKFIEFQQTYYNKSLADQVLNKMEKNKIIVSDHHIIQKAEPVFKYPENKLGRAHFYAPVKNFAGLQMSTFFFNVMIIWLITIFLYVCLQFKLIQRILEISVFLKKNKK